MDGTELDYMPVNSRKLGQLRWRVFPMRCRDADATPIPGIVHIDQTRMNGASTETEAVDMPIRSHRTIGR